MTLEESREIIPLMESMIGQIEEQQTLMTEMILEMQNRDTQLSLMQEQNQKLQKLNSELSELLNILPKNCHSNSWSVVLRSRMLWVFQPGWLIAERKSLCVARHVLERTCRKTP